MDQIINSAVALTQELVRVPSESSEAAATRGSPESGIAAVLQRICEDNAIVWQRQKVFPDRYNFIASLPKPGSPKILFLAHMDTVGVGGMRDAFSGEIKNNRIWGRGACDDKGSLAALLAVISGLKAVEKSLLYDVTLAATVDEECSMSGAAVLARENPSGWDLCVGMEPTLLQPVSAHRGVYRCRILGHNKAEFAVQEIIADLSSFQEIVAKASHPNLGKAVMTVTEIKAEGGGRHRILVDIRLLPVHSPAKIHAQVLRIVGERGKVIPLFAGYGIDSDPQNTFIQSFQRSLSDHGLDKTLGAVPYATDCSQLRGRGACLVWGPGNPKQAHQNEEYIEVGQLASACRILMNFLSHC